MPVCYCIPYHITILPRASVRSLTTASFDQIRIEKSVAASATYLLWYPQSAYSLKCRQCCCNISHRSFVLHNYWNPQFSRPVINISLSDLVGAVPPSPLSQFGKPHLVPLETLNAILYYFDSYVHHPARISIFTPLSKLLIYFIVFLVFPILIIIWMGTITQTVSTCVQHYLYCLFRHSGCQSRLFSISDFFHWHCHYLRVFNWLLGPSSHSIHIMLDPFRLLFIADDILVLSFVHQMLLLGL